MKIRSGFVSNSSSSCFMMRGGNIEEIAPHMLGIIIESFSEVEEGNGTMAAAKREYKKWRENLKIALRRKDVKDGTIGITMPSCNYDTYLVYDDDYLYVTTCNNHTWGFNGINYEDSEEYASIRDMVRSKFYFNVRNKLIHSYEHYINDDRDTECPKCKNYYGCYVIDQKGNRICGSCFAGKLAPTEAMKLEQLRVKVQTKGVRNPITSLDLED